MSRPRLRVIRVCGGVRGRGRWVTSPGAFTLRLAVLLSSRSARWLTAFLLVSFSPLLSSPLLPSAPLRSSPPLRSSAFDYLREGDGGGGRRREGGTLSDSPGSLEIATLPTVLCIRRAFCNEASNHPLLFLPFPSLRPIDNWRKLYAGVRRVKPMECLPFIVLICSAVSILHGGYTSPRDSIYRLLRNFLVIGYCVIWE